MKLAKYRFIAVISWLTIALAILIVYIQDQPVGSFGFGQIVWMAGVVFQFILSAIYIRDRLTSGTGVHG
ncbi:hypothetical protein [Hoeflea sp. TYP-13]|uniref:hypothetical protein n=1 Tax=Hoeflea sp. TYP-13 TaxID=3230023 RepID=UPI0034C65001